MKEYILEEAKPGLYRKGYKIQKFDIQTMKELNIDMPSKLEEIAKVGFKKEELEEFLYFEDTEIINFLAEQDYLRNLEEFAHMNSYELNIVLKYYEKEVIELEKEISTTNDKKNLIELKNEIIILKNGIKSIRYIKENFRNKHKKNIK